MSPLPTGADMPLSKEDLVSLEVIQTAQLQFAHVRETLIFFKSFVAWLY